MTPRIRRQKRLWVLFLLLAATPAATAGTTVSHVRVQGDTVTAIFAVEPPDPGNCVLNLVAVVAADLIEKVLQSGRTQFLRTTVTVAQFDTCVGDLLFIGEGSTDVADLQISSNLRTATLAAMVAVTDALSGTVSNFQLNLTWKATSKASTVNSVDSFKDKDLGIKIKTHSHSTMAEAVATGTVIGIGQNFTPEPSESGTIQRGNDGTHTVQKDF